MNHADHGSPITDFMGKLFILSAPSGAGKTSLAKALVASTPNLAVSVSHTTRPPRPGERDGVDYHFVDESRFQEMLRTGQFLEHAKVFDHYYATSRAAVEQLLAAGKDVIFDVDWQGARAIKQRMPTAISIFILPPSRAVLEERLVGRGQDSAAVIKRRMQAAVAEMRHYQEFDHLVLNDEFSLALQDLKAIVGREPARARAFRLNMEAMLASE